MWEDGAFFMAFYIGGITNGWHFMGSKHGALHICMPRLENTVELNEMLGT